MYHNSLKNLQVDYIDYYLLHMLGAPGKSGLQGRFLDNGLLDFLLKEREAGRIRHLGWSFHGTRGIRPGTGHARPGALGLRADSVELFRLAARIGT